MHAHRKKYCQVLVCSKAALALLGTNTLPEAGGVWGPGGRPIHSLRGGRPLSIFPYFPDEAHKRGCHAT